VQVRLADVRVPGRLQPPHGLGRIRRHVLGEDRRSVRRHEPGRVEQVLDAERDPLGDRLGTREEDAGELLHQPIFFDRPIKPRPV
jgi:hypothetical protein